MLYGGKDRQDVPAVGVCPRCHGELYSGEEAEEEICTTCSEELSRWDQNTAQTILEEMDFQLQKYLSDDLRSTIWNAIAPRFLKDAET